jgi:hypothetical protein
VATFPAPAGSESGRFQLVASLPLDRYTATNVSLRRLRYARCIIVNAKIRASGAAMGFVVGSVLALVVSLFARL